MLNNEIEKIWQNSNKFEVVEFDKAELQGELNKNLQYFDRLVKRRNIRENIGAALVMILSGAGLFIFNSLLSQIGMIIGVLYGALVIIMLWKTKQKRPLAYGLPTIEFLKKYRDYLAGERNLASNVIYWYLAPPYIACLLFFIGEEISIIHLAINLLGILALYSFIFFRNKKGVKKTFNPLIEKVDQAISELTIETDYI
jgi:phage-related minor tail protein